MFFNEQAKTWDTPQSLQRAKALAELLQNHWGSKKLSTVLEFGCGTGSLTFALGDSSEQYIGYDTAENMLEIYREKAPSDRYTTIESLDQVSDSSLDAVYTSMVLHHVDNIDFVLEQFAAKLKPGGLLSVIDLDAGSESFHKGINVEVFHHGFQRETFADIVAGHGFEVLRIETAFNGVKELPDGGQRDYTMFILTGHKK